MNSEINTVGLKHEIAHEIRSFLWIALYLTVFFSLLRWYTQLAMHEYQVDYGGYGYVVLQSLALAKLILTGEALRLGERYRERPLIAPTLYKTLVFSAFVAAFHILEHLIMGWVEGENLREIVQKIPKHGWAHLFSMMLVIFVAFIPFFAFRELERVLGEGKLRDLFFSRREAAKLDEARAARN